MCTPPSVFLFNARSLLPKIDDLCVTVKNFQPNIVMVTETWSCEDIHDCLLYLPHFSLFRADRSGRRGGGVCCWINQALNPTMFPIPFAPPPCIEVLFISLYMGPLHIVVCTVYIPPGLPRSQHDSIRIFLVDSFDDFLKNDANLHIIIGGYYNDFPITFLQENFNLVNKVITPTRCNSILDMLLVGEDLADIYEDSTEVGPPIRNSDHNSVLLRPLNPVPLYESLRRIPVWDFRVSHLSEFLRKLKSTSYDSLQDCSDVNEWWMSFTSCFSSVSPLFPVVMYF